MVLICAQISWMLTGKMNGKRIFILQQTSVYVNSLTVNERYRETKPNWLMEAIRIKDLKTVPKPNKE